LRPEALSEEEVATLVQRLSRLIGDLPVGAVQADLIDSGRTQIVYSGTRGTYLIMAGGEGPVVQVSGTDGGPVKGIFYVVAKDAERQAARLISKIFQDVGPLTFMLGYMDAADDGVHWKRYSAAAGEITILTRTVRDPGAELPALSPWGQRLFTHGVSYLQGEIVIGQQVVGFAQRPDGAVGKVAPLPESELARAAADSLGLTDAGPGPSDPDDSDRAAISALVSRISSLIGDKPAGMATITEGDDGHTSVTYRGARGLYIIPKADDDPFVVVCDPDTEEASGIYNVAPQIQDTMAAEIVGKLLPPLGPLSFVLGYQSLDPDGTNWKRFTAEEGGIVVLTRQLRDAGRRQPRRTTGQAYVAGEIVGPDWVVGFRGRPDGKIDQIAQLPESRLAPGAAGSLPPRHTLAFEDAQEGELRALLPPDLRDEMRTVLETFLAAEPLAQKAAPGTVIEGAAACEYVEHCMRWMIAEAARASTATSSAHWLYLLRRLPQQLLAAEQRGTSIANQFTAEVLSAMGGGAGAGTVAAGNADGQETHQFDVPAELIPALVRLLACARLHVELTAMYRWCAKGAALEFPGPDADPGAFVRRVQDDELAAAVALYDARGAAAGPGGMGWRLQSGALLLSKSDLYERQDDTTDSVVMAVMPVAASEPVIVDADQFREILGIPKGVRRLQFTPRFAHQDIGLTEIADFMRQGYWADRSLIGLLTVLRSVFQSDVPTYLNVSLRGYAVCAAQRLEELLGDSLDDLRPLFPGAVEDLRVADVLSEIRTGEGSEGSVWPVQPGPILRSAGGYVLLDMAAASSALLAAMSIPGRGGGRLPNLRGSVFEQNVQDMIEFSPWRPGAELRAMRGRALRVGGRTVTDLDAVGEQDGVLLAVSVKSIPYSGDLERGEYRAVRNLADRCESWVADWAQRLRVLRESPRGDNYDLTPFRNVIGVVVLPTVPFCRLGPATEEVAPGLRAVSALTELASWVTADPAELPGLPATADHHAASCARTAPSPAPEAHQRQVG
jgi:hypothetical protein